MNISIIIPCYNESSRIDDMVLMLEEFKIHWQGQSEIIFVDDGSEQPLKKVLEQRPTPIAFEYKIFRLEENQGKGAAIQLGVQKAQLDFVLTIDADGSYHPLEVEKWIKKSGIPQEDEIWIGSRMHQDSVMRWEGKESKTHQNVRKWLGVGYNIYVKLLTNIDSYDTQSGIKLYPRVLADYLFKHINDKGWVHDVAVLYQATLRDIRIVEQPVNCIHKTGSKVRLTKDTKDMFFKTLKVSIQEKINYFIVEPIKAVKNTLTVPKHLEASKYRRESIFRGLFVIWALFLLVAMPILSKDFAIAGDEWIQNEYGKEIYNYFAHGDPRAYQEVGRIQQYDAIVYYSGGFELLLVTISKWFPNSFEYDIRHALVALSGALLFIFTGLLGRRFAGWTVGLVSLLFISLSPRLLGEAMNNSKDIPFALGVVFTLYHIVALLRQFPNPSWKSATWVTLGLIFTYNIRIGALIVVGYLGVFSVVTLIQWWISSKNHQEKESIPWGKLIVKYAFILVVSYFLGIITWPWAMQNPLINPLDSMKQMANFPITLRLLHEGVTINTAFVPWDYIPKWISITSPEVILILFILSLPLFIWQYSKIKGRKVYILYFTLLFPIVFAIIQSSVLYDGWRHFLFVYPSLVILAAWTFVYLWEILQKAWMKKVWVALISIGMVLPIQSIASLHPYEYLYFNHAFGGLKKALGQYETDYYFTSAKEAIYTLAEKENFKSLTDSVYIRTNMVKEVTEYAKTISPYLVVEYLKFESRVEAPYDFAIFNSRFLDLPVLQAGSWPPKNELYFQIERQGIPLSIVLRKPSQEDYLGFAALQEGRMEEALAYFQSYLSKDPDNEVVLYYSGIAAMNLKNFYLATTYLEHSIKLYPNDASILNYALSSLHLGEANQALNMLGTYFPRIQKSLNFYLEVLKKDANNVVALNLAQMDQEIIKGYYEMIIESYRQLGDHSKVQQYGHELMKLQ